MKALNTIGITFLTLGILFLGTAMILPSNVHVERSLVIPASPELVFNHINDLREWKEWSPWHRPDPETTILYEGKLKGQGASYSWTSKESRGKLTITESHPYKYIAADLDFIVEGQALGYYRLEQVEEGTLVTWGVEAEMGNGPVSKYTALLINNRIGPDFEEGLNNLKAHLEQSSEMVTDSRAY